MNWIKSRIWRKGKRERQVSKISQKFLACFISWTEQLAQEVVAIGKREEREPVRSGYNADRVEKHSYWLINKIISPTRAYNTNIFRVSTRTGSPLSIATLDEGRLVSIAVNSTQPHFSSAGSETLRNFSHACETKFKTDNSSVLCLPAVITNCTPFSPVKHLNTAFFFRAAAAKSYISFGSSLLYNTQKGKQLNYCNTQEARSDLIAPAVLRPGKWHWCVIERNTPLLQ